MEKLIIDRATWRTGNNSPNRTGRGTTALKNRQGFHCCLGFFCIQSSINPNSLLDVGEPYELRINIPFLTTTDTNYDTNYDTNIDRCNYLNTDFTNTAMSINDDKLTTSEEKEVLITKHFNSVGIDVEFINNYTT